MNPLYLDTARLLMEVAPLVLRGDLFALKGGAAINLFVRDMPRLSIDLDLLLLDHSVSRDAACQRMIPAALNDCARILERQDFSVTTASGKLFARYGNIQLRIEVNLVLRGVVHPPARRSLSLRAQDTLGVDIEIPVASLEDVYAGKLVAALDRQHPRDLFDVLHLYRHEGITPAIRRAFVIYLASHRRPVHEVLAPQLRDLSHEYHGAFHGLTVEPVDLEQLLDVRARLIRDLQRDLDENERSFLRSLVNANPEWQLLEVAHAAELPALRWKLENLQWLATNDPKKFAAQARALEALLN